jgi:hypothetical protein
MIELGAMARKNRMNTVFYATLGQGARSKVKSMRARLVPSSGGPPVEIVKDMTLLGRGEDCDIRVDHKSVSKLHCIIVKTDGLLLLRDLGSTNGTRVNGQRVRRAALLPNDNLSVANVRYDVKFGGDLDADLELQSMPMILDEDRPDRSAEPIRRNTLPDVYPDSSPKRP